MTGPRFSAPPSATHITLLPRPKQWALDDGIFDLTAVTPIVTNGDGASDRVARRLAVALRQRVRWKGNPKPDPGQETEVAHIRLVVDPSPAQPSQGYRVTVEPGRIQLIGYDEPGLFYAVQTLLQLIRCGNGRPPCCRIEDHPDLPVRGVMLDISRDKVPTMETLYRLVDLFAALKLNHLELYTEHTFAYRNHEDIWRDASPMTSEEIRALDRFCLERYVELVPNQNSFGHFHRWLKKPRYRELAETQGPFDYPWGGSGQGPFSLDPGHPGSLALLDELYAELLPNFSSRRFNVGCDETFDLGAGRSEAACRSRGKGRVYLEFLLKIHALTEKYGRTMHFWGDIILKHPNLVPELPDNVVVLDWGYEADHPFRDECRQFAASGKSFYVCPGTSSWLSLAGRTENCLRNIESAAVQGRSFGASGLLTTDWGDRGHWQVLPASYVGFAAGAAYGWCAHRKAEADIGPAVGLHLFGDSSRVMGTAAGDLGNVYRCFATPCVNQSMLYRMLTTGSEEMPGLEITAEEIEAAEAAVEAAMETLAGAVSTDHDTALVMEEFALASGLMLHACARSRAFLDGKPPNGSVYKALADDLESLVEPFRSLWLRRNRPGGLTDSTARFDVLLEGYRAGGA